MPTPSSGRESQEKAGEGTVIPQTGDGESEARGYRSEPGLSSCSECGSGEKGERGARKEDVGRAGHGGAEGREGGQEGRREEGRKEQGGTGIPGTFLPPPERSAEPVES